MVSTRSASRSGEADSIQAGAAQQSDESSGVESDDEPLVRRAPLSKGGKSAKDTSRDKRDVAKQGPYGSIGSGVDGTDIFSLLASKDAADFLSSDETLSRLCRKSILESYNEQSKVEFGQNISVTRLVPQRRKLGLPPLGPIPLLEVGSHFDTDQLWEELELRNKPFISFAGRHIRRFQNAQNISEENAEKDNMRHPETVSGDDENGSSEVGQAEEPEPETSDASDSDDMDQENEQDAIIDGSPSDEGQPRPFPTRKVRFAQDTKIDIDGDTLKQNEKPSVEDGFFSLEAMEQFANEAEHLALEGKLMDSDDDESDDGADMDDSDTEKGIGEIAGNEERMRYQDFFDPPVQTKNLNLGDKALRVSNALGTSDLEEEEERGTAATPLEVSRVRTRRLIDAMEEENVGKKPWQLRGEVTAGSRPRDSLLETTLDHDSSIRKSSVAEEDRNETIEDIIRQRIVDNLYDDVVPAFPETYNREKSKSKKDLPEVSQEKPTESLAEVYAREFVSEKEKAQSEAASREVERAREQPETAEQREINRLYEKIAAKLDALSGLHFTPSPAKIAPEMVIGKNIKALASEEAIPDVVSDKAVLTPKEVYSVDKRDLNGDKELTKSERRASRGRSKTRIRKAKHAKTRATELMNKSNPVISEKRRAEAALLRKGKKIRLAEPNVAGTPTSSKLLGQKLAVEVSDPKPKSAAGLVL